MARRWRADKLLRIVQQRKHRRDLWYTEVKTGPSTLQQTVRLDGLAIRPSWTAPLFSGYEVKVSRQDFIRDTKWQAYLAYCHRFSFVCPDGLIAPGELPEEVGLYWINAHGRLRCVRIPRGRILPELPASLLYYLILSRAEPDRHPFFSSTREMLEAWIEEKVDLRSLADKVKSQLVQQLAQLERERDQLAIRCRALEVWETQMRAVLKRFDLSDDPLRLEKQLAERQSPASIDWGKAREQWQALMRTLQGKDVTRQ